MAEPSSNKLLPPLAGDENSGSPRTAWAQVVRGPELEVMSAGPKSSSSPPPPSPSKTVEQAASSDCSASEDIRPENADANHSNAGHPKKAAWNKPLNGVIEVGPVMGGVTAWPALSESARTPMKSASDSPSPVADASVASSQGPVISNSTPDQEQGSSTTPNPNVTRNNTGSTRQRSSRRGGGAGGAPLRGGVSRSSTTNPPPPPSPLTQVPAIPVPPPYPLYEMPFGPMGPAVPYVSQPNSVNVQSPQRSSPRRGNFGGRPRGDGSHQDGHGGRRGQDRDWNASRSPHSRDGNAPPQIVPPGDFLVPPPSPPHLIPPHAMRPFTNPMGFDMTAPFFYVPAMPMPFVPPPPMLFPVVAPPLPTVLVNQIDYYFSDSNLARDNFLRSNMDEEGWVPVSLIANFPRVKSLTDNTELILDSVKASQVVEVEGNKIRKRNEWRKWVPNSSRLPAEPTEAATLATSLEKVTVHVADATPEKISPSRSSTEDSKINHSGNETSET